MLDIMAAAYRDLLLALILLAIFKWLSLSICDPSLSFASGWLQNGAVPTGRRGTGTKQKHYHQMRILKPPWTKAVQVLIVSYNHEFNFRFFALTGKECAES